MAHLPGPVGLVHAFFRTAVRDTAPAVAAPPTSNAPAVPAIHCVYGHGSPGYEFQDRSPYGGPPVVGTSDLTAVDQIAANGLVPFADDTTVGRPKVPVTGQQAVVAR